MTEDRTWMKKTCELCPFSRSKTLWLHPERAEEFAMMATNPYNDFPCHKTADYHEDNYTGEGGFYHGEHSFTCHGFMTVRHTEIGGPDGFEPDGDGFCDTYEMIEHHLDHYRIEHPDYEMYDDGEEA